MGFDELGAYVLDVEEGSVAQQAAALLPDSHVVGAFHHLSAVLLEDLSRPTLDGDVMVVGDDREAIDTVQALAGRLPGMRGIYAGPAAQRPPGRGADHQPRVGEPPVQGARRRPGHRRLKPVRRRPRDGVRRAAAAPGRVSLVPSLTEAIAATDVALLVGATDWCTHPAGLDVARVGGTKWPDLDRVLRCGRTWWSPTPRRTGTRTSPRCGPPGSPCG